MKSNLSKVIDQVPPLKCTTNFEKGFLQAHQETLYLAEILQRVHLTFLDTLYYLQNYPGALENTETTASIIQDHSRRSILSRSGEK